MPLDTAAGLGMPPGALDNWQPAKNSNLPSTAAGLGIDPDKFAAMPAAPAKPPAADSGATETQVPMPNPVWVDPNSGTPYFDQNTPEGRYWNKGVNEGQARAVEKIGEGTTFGLLPYGIAGARTLAGTPFQQGLQEAREYTEKTSEMAPGASMVLEGMGSLPWSAATGGLVNPAEAALIRQAAPYVGKAAPYLVRPLVQGATNAVLGGVEAAGHDVGSGKTENIGGDIGRGALIGGVLGAGGTVAGDVAQAGYGAAKKAVNWLGEKGIGFKESYPGSAGGTVRGTPQQQQAAAQKLGLTVDPTDAEAGQQSILSKVQEPEQVPAYDESGSVTGYQSLPPGSPIPDYRRTLAQQTQLPGVVAADTTYRTSGRFPEFDQNTHRQQGVLARQLNQLPGATGNPQSVGQFFTAQLNDIDTARTAATTPMTQSIERQTGELGGTATPTESGLKMQATINQQQSGRQAIAAQMVQEAQGQRDSALAATPVGKQDIPGGATAPEQYGAEVRGTVLTNRKATTNQENDLWAAIDPTKQAGAQSQPFKERVQHVYDLMPNSAKKPSGEEANILDTIQNWPEVVPLTEFQAIRTRLNDAISEEVLSRGTTTDPARRMITAKGALDSALEDTIDAHNAAEQQAVRAGQMSPEATMEARMRAHLGLSQTASPAMRPYVAEEIQRLKQARDFSRQRAQTFDEGVIGEITAPGQNRSAAKVPADVTRTKGGFDVADPDIMNKLWNGKNIEAANLRAAQEAGITPELLKAHAADDLRSFAVDEKGNFDPQKWRQWSRDHAAGLHIFPEVKDAFNNVAKAQETVAARQAESEAVSASHPLRGVDQPSEIPGKYVVKGDTGADMVRQYIRDTNGSPDAMQAFDDSLVRKMREAGAVEQGQIDPNKLATFRNDYKGALSQRNEVSGKLSNLADAQTELNRVEGEYAKRQADIQNGVAKNFLNDDPLIAVRKAFSSSNPAQTFRGLVDAVGGNVDAKAGLRRAVADYLVEKFHGSRPATETEDFLKSAQLRSWLRQNRDSLVQIGGGQWLNVMDQIGAELRRSAQVAETAVGSQTTQRLFTAKHAGLAPSSPHGSGSAFLWGWVGEHLAGPVGVLAAIGKPLVNVVRQAGLETKDQLMAAMLMDHEVARALLVKVSVKPTPMQINQAVRALSRFAAMNTTGS